uniref:Dual specificity protein kinase TTK n=1 Tax=Mastacembelus armatus TaxID=205130 RepID=A0A7N9ART9_9TELE
MEEEEHTDRKQQFAMIFQRLNKIKKYLSDDDTDNINQVIGSNSPESCLSYLMDLEKKGDPHLNHNHLTRLIDFYTRVFFSMPLGKYCQNESYARMLVRFAELKAIQDINEAEDNFNVARSHSPNFAFVHIAHARFEHSQGNTKRGIYILKNAIEQGAKPKKVLEATLQSMQSGKRQVFCSEDKENAPCEQTSGSNVNPVFGLSSSKKNAADGDLLNLEVSINLPYYFDQVLKRNSPESCWTYLMNLEKRGNPRIDVSLLNKLKHCYSKVFSKLPIRQYSKNASYAKILVRYAELKGIEDPEEALDYFIVATSNCKEFAFVHIAHAQFQLSQGNVMKATSILHKAQALNARPAEHLEVAMHKLKASITPLSNESITIKGKQFFILKMIGRGGSSKVYQVLDHKKQLFAVKYVDLEEADAQTIESYKNEIGHLNHLQQYSDQIIKLYDYEITNSYIYMLMECGNLDLNTWLRNRKTVNPLDRKFYWKNMLEAVHTIHKHGIVHSDLKPANFVIVNGSLKLIDFGIANRIQPDVTSIMKDSQVGTLNYMPPEAIKDTSSKPGKARSKISPKGDVWSLGCILYYMTYGKTPFQSITNQITKLQAIIDPSHKIQFPDISEKDLLDVLKRCLVRNPRERISLAELLDHPYLQLKPQGSPEPGYTHSSKILTDLAALQSPNSIIRAANNLAKMCNSGKKLDVAECAKSSS